MSLHTAEFGVEGKRAIVTGASQGIGRTVAETLATGGADVAICSRSQDRVDPVAEEINEDPDAGECLAVECNVRERDDVEAFVEATVEAFGGVDILVNNAGGEFVAAFDDISPNGWEAIVDLNLTGTFHCTQVAGEAMRGGSENESESENESGNGNGSRNDGSSASGETASDAENPGGVVINMSSVNGQHAAPNESHYSAAKAAIIRLTETLAVEWADHGIRVNCVAPGLVQTPGVADSD